MTRIRRARHHPSAIASRRTRLARIIAHLIAIIFHRARRCIKPAAHVCSIHGGIIGALVTPRFIISRSRRSILIVSTLTSCRVINRHHHHHRLSYGTRIARWPRHLGASSALSASSMLARRRRRQLVTSARAVRMTRRYALGKLIIVYLAHHAASRHNVNRSFDSAVTGWHLSINGICGSSSL